MSILVQNPWILPAATPGPPSLSERLIRALEAHLAAVSQDATDYQRRSEQAADPIVQLVLGIILEDAQRHASLLRRMIHSLQQEVEFTPSFTALPVASPDQEAAHAEMLHGFRALIRNEHEGARYLRHLARQEPGLYSGLYAALFETMARDSEKHATLLRYVLRHLEAGAPA